METRAAAIESQSLLIEVFFPTDLQRRINLAAAESQSLLIEVFFPTNGWVTVDMSKGSQSLLNEVFFPT